ncbi:MAG: FAD-dependent oxidoreductase [Planctomycetes bacterium]|nr:FAD-dependent oxidoreductase [Planctomycetota bacterium]
MGEAGGGVPRVVVLGGGPAGLGAAWQLAARGRARVTLVEQNSWFGGNAASFEWEGQRLDFGSHRLHPACDPAILAELKQLLRADLIDRPRHGRIRLLGRFIHFPLKPLDLALRLPPSFGLGLAKDGLLKPLRRGVGGDTFAAVLQENLGPVMCRRFYFPYARKLWGRDPAELSGIQARRRVAAGTVWKLVRKVLSMVPGLKKPGAGRFWYPRLGFGQISDAIAAAAQRSGAELLLEHRVKLLESPRGAAPWRVWIDRGGKESVLEADFVWSTLPVTLVPKLLAEPPPAAIAAATSAVRYRAMLLIYLKLPIERFTEFDAHYFPEAEIAITRLSEPKNYPGLGVPHGSTTLCAELPCELGDDRWKADDRALGDLVAADLARAGIPLPVAPSAVRVMRLPQAYPTYLNGYEQPLAELDRFCDALPRFLTFGRQGLFQHDNTHHALAMAWGAVDCLDGGRFDAAKWGEYRKVFATHVVED